MYTEFQDQMESGDFGNNNNTSSRIKNGTVKNGTVERNEGF